MSSSFFVNTGGSAAERETISNDLTASANAKADAQKLAINPEDSQFTLSDNTTIGNSALHHAAKAEASATSAAGSASTATQQAGVATQAKLDAQSATADALTYRNEAVDANNNAVLVTGAQTIAGAKTFSNAMIVNDTVTADGVTVGTGDVITVGEYANSADGTSQNLRFYINANGNAYIDHGHETGGLIVLGRNFNVKNDASEMLIQTTDTTTSLYHNSSANPKLNTTATGIDVTGTVTADGGTIDGNLQVTKGNKLIIGDGSSSTGGLEIYHQSTGNHTVIKDSGTGHTGGSVYFRADQLHLQNEDYSKTYFRGMSDSVVIFDGKGSADSNVAIRPTDTDLIVYQRGLSFADAENATGDAGTNYTRIIQSGSANADTTLTLPTTTGNLLVDDGSGNVDVTGTVTADGMTVSSGTAAFPVKFTSEVDNSNFVLESTKAASSNDSPEMVIYRNTTGAANNRTGSVRYKGKNNLDAPFTTARLQTSTPNVTAGSETGRLWIELQDNANTAESDGLVTVAQFDPTGLDVTGTVTSDKLKVDTTTDVKALQIISSHTGSGATPDVSIERSAIPSGTTNGYHSIGNFNFVGMNATESGGTYSTGSSSIEYARMAVIANEHLTGSETGRVSFGVYDHAKAGGAGLVGSLDIYPHKVSTGVDLDVTGTVTASGNVLLGTTVSSSFTDSGYRFNVGDAGYAEFVRTTTTDNSANVYVVRKSDGRVFSFRKNNEVGKIEIDETSTSYTTSSDYRLKTDVQPMTGATDRLKQLNPVNFQWIADGTRVDGFLAHEAQAVVPEAVTGAKDAVDDEGNPDYQGIDQSKLVPLLVATIKELEARITALEA